jgi:hypothetical protein
MLNALSARLAGDKPPPMLKDLRGWDRIDPAVEIDQSPIGRPPWSFNDMRQGDPPFNLGKVGRSASLMLINACCGTGH